MKVICLFSDIYDLLLNQKDGATCKCQNKMLTYLPIETVLCQLLRLLVRS